MLKTEHFLPQYDDYHYMCRAAKLQLLLTTQHCSQQRCRGTEVTQLLIRDRRRGYRKFLARKRQLRLRPQ